MSENTTTAPEPLAPPVTYTGEQLLGAELAKALEKNPLNQQLRGLVLAATGKLVTVEAAPTYEQLVTQLNEAGARPPVKKASTSARPAVATATFSLFIEVTDTEHGTCDYSVTRSGASDYTLTRAELRDIAEDSDDWADFFRSVMERMDDMASEDPPDMEFSDDIRHSDYDSNDWSDESRDFAESRRSRAEMLRDWMGDHLPDELRRLDGEEEDDE